MTDNPYRGMVIAEVHVEGDVITARLESIEAKTPQTLDRRLATARDEWAQVLISRAGTLTSTGIISLNGDQPLVVPLTNLKAIVIKTVKHAEPKAPNKGSEQAREDKDGSVAISEKLKQNPEGITGLTASSSHAL